MAAADDDGQVVELGAVALLYRCVERVAVEMGDGEVVKIGVTKRARRAAGRAGPGVGRRPLAAVAAEGMYDGIIEPGAGRAKSPCAWEAGADGSPELE